VKWSCDEEHPVIGRQVSHFYIIRRIGSGGMGVVYEAQDTHLPRSVAIKFLTPNLLGSDDAIKRFTREARLAASLNHPNICTVLDIGEADGQSFIVMELLHGLSLKTRLSAGRVSLMELVDVASQVASGLAAAQAQGIIHRDITPGNVFLTDSGVVKLLDFGLAKQGTQPDFEAEYGDDASDSLTKPGAVVGTIHYMAPERLVDTASVDYRCDLFSLGAVVYHMATGAPPFDMSPRQALIAMICTQPPVPLRRLAPQHPAELERIVNRLLDKSPGQRYQSADELRADLAALGRSAQKPPAPRVDMPPASHSLAVLPFDLTGEIDDGLARFRDGLAEQVRARLSRVAGVRVAPRTSTLLLAGLGLRDIGHRLGVEMVLEGTIHQSQGQVRLTANLVAAADERAICPMLSLAHAADESLSQQDRASTAICECLASSFAGPSTVTNATADSENSDAVHALKRGLHVWRDCFTNGWRPAIEHYEHAIDRDPQFARAHVALANAYNFAGFYGLIKSGLAFSVAARAASRALAIDDTMAAAHRELALAQFGGDWDWEGSDAAFRRALALDPGDAAAHVQYSWLLILLGRTDAAFAEAQRAHGLAPASRLIATAHAQTLYIAGRYDEAIAICSACLAADRSYVWALQLRGLCYLAQANQSAAIDDLERAATGSQRKPYYLGLLGRCYGHFGMTAEALALVAELQRLPADVYVPPQSYVFIYAGLGEKRRALAYQDQAYADGASPLNYLTPCIRGFYALDAYHKRRLEQMRLSL
jgi:eukaryotic-like serine/threonine-protein kinase